MTYRETVAPSIPTFFRRWVVHHGTVHYWRPRYMKVSEFSAQAAMCFLQDGHSAAKMNLASRSGLYHLALPRMGVLL